MATAASVSWQEPGGPRRIWFHRRYLRRHTPTQPALAGALSGGQVKHAQYVQHVRHTPGFVPRVTFSVAPGSPAALARERAALWPVGTDEFAPDWTPSPEDVFFLAGPDWRYLLAKGLEDLPNPRLNLVQHVRHAAPGHPLRVYLPLRAIRICVSPEVAAAVTDTGEAEGPVLTIPNGTDLPLPPPEAALRRPPQATIVGYKEPVLAAALAERLARRGAPHRLLDTFLPRQQFLDMLLGSAVAVCLPRATEGFYLPALEAMAAGCVVVTLDCVGNRSFCRDGVNCLVGERQPAALAATVERALRLGPAARSRLLAAARETAERHSLAAERRRFQALLRDVDVLWADSLPGRLRGTLWRWRALAPGASPEPSGGGAAAAARKPVVDFMVVGVAKGGTTALWQFLRQHPQIGMALPKEVHLFDDPASEGAAVADLDESYRPWFAYWGAVRLRGEATPAYLVRPEVAPRLKRYNPALKLIVLLRDPVQRALSAHRFQSGRGRDRLPFALALVCEGWRLRRDARRQLRAKRLPSLPAHDEARRRRSPPRAYAYRRRGLYAEQLANLYAHFEPRQVLVLRSEDLLRNQDAVLRRVFRFLGVDESALVPLATVLVAERQDDNHRIACALLRLTYWRANRRLRRLLAETGTEL